jgi:DNA-binding transcriptional MerR regulator
VVGRLLRPALFRGTPGREPQPDPSISSPGGIECAASTGSIFVSNSRPRAAGACLCLHKHMESLECYRKLRADRGNTLTECTGCRADVAPGFEAARTDQPAPATGPRMNTRTLFDPMGRADADIVWADAEPALPSMWAHVEPVPPSTDAAEITTRQMCEKFNLPARTLRFYAGRGLLAPTRRGRERLYGPLDQLHLAFILKGRRLGFTLDEIAQMIALREGRGPASAQRELQQKCFDRIQQLEIRLMKMTDILADLRCLRASL